MAFFVQVIRALRLEFMEVHPVVKTDIYCFHVKLVNRHKIRVDSSILEEHLFLVSTKLSLPGGTLFNKLSKHYASALVELGK